MSIHLSSATRLVARAGLSFEPVQDPRRRQGKRHPLAGLLKLIVFAFVVGRRTLRGQEGLSEDLGPKRLGRLGLTRPVSDTRCHDVTKALSPDDFREVMYRQVGHGIAQGDIRKNDFLPHGAMAIDGKGAGGGMGEAPNDVARQSVCDAKGTKCWDVFALRAVLISAAASPCLDQIPINAKTGEATTFPMLLDRINGRFKGLVRYITSDAGLTSKSNAEKVLSSDQHFVFAVKGNQPRLHEFALQAFVEAKMVASSFERAQGQTVDRFLYVVDVSGGKVDFPGATELWCVQSVKTGKNDEVEVETRYMVVSIPPDELAPYQKLLLVRLHWHIENNSNWTADVVLGEDTRCPVKTGNGALVVSWLTMLALNILASVRANLKQKDKRPPAWKRVQDKLYQALFSEEESPDASATPV